MAGGRLYHYLLDGLTTEKAAIIRRSLAIVPEIRSLDIDVGRSTVEATATRDVEPQIRLACDVAGVVFRTRAR